MPRLSDSMEEGTILTWLKQVGDEIAVGDEIVEIETDKANMAYEADEAGTLTEILAQEGETLPIGSPIARIGDSTNGDGVPPTTTMPPTEEEKSQDGERVKASPLAKRLARDKGLELKDLHGSGPGGRIVKHDVEEAASPVGGAGGGAEHAAQAPPQVAGPAGHDASSETAKGAVQTQDLNKLQQTISRRMAESKATAPHFYLTIEIDMGKAVEARAGFKAAAGEGDVVPSFNDMVVKACAIALREFPKANGAYRDGRFELYSRINVGVAVAAEEALVVPTVFDADKKGLRQIAADTRAVAAKVRDGSVTPPELSGGTFTVSNLGMFGIDEFDAVINMGQAAILAVGAIREAPAVRDGEIAPAHLMKATLSCDHRILYGAEGAEFLARVRQLLEEPVSLAL